MFKRVCAEAGTGDGWTPRELRTSFVSLMSHRGVSIEEIARLAGHATTRTTEIVYRRELRPVITTGAEIMDQLFTGNLASAPVRGAAKDPDQPAAGPWLPDRNPLPRPGRRWPPSRSGWPPRTGPSAGSPPDQIMVTRDRSLAHNMSMQDASGRAPPRDSQEHWQQQVQLSRGHWRRADAAGTIRSAGWWESVTVTWLPAPAPARRPAVLQRTLEAAAGMIAPVLADVAVTSARRLLQRRSHRLLVASLLRRQPAPAARKRPRSDRTP
jgi:Phage integrase family